MRSAHNNALSLFLDVEAMVDSESEEEERKEEEDRNVMVQDGTSAKILWTSAC